ncbi:hypothetical protein GRZ55_10995 [Chelativorans sp. ZYF759]|uniref:deoxycytidylate deaminase n=1 Tax=Chelativorans sp. ZYF759 TaxID=2692213 RepID=UPI00145FC054|nr:hypothetical protein [Chelativorans sp. ZYF759]
MAISHNDLRLLRQSQAAQEGSHDPHRKVGAVIADANGRILGVGANAPPKRLSLTLLQSHAAVEGDPHWKYHVLEHAERNAIFSALQNGSQLLGATMYGTLFPCADCARAIVAVGIARVVVPSPGGDAVRDQKWLDHYRYARSIFELAGVTVEMVPQHLLAQPVEEPTDTPHPSGAS